MKPHIILIASVLKPADDIRMARKIGKSIAKLPGTEVHIAGFTSKQETIEGLVLHPLFTFSRLSPKRAFANAKVLTLALRLKPTVFILSTHELLPAALLLKFLRGTKLIYDVQENYYRNIIYTDAFPGLIRKPLAGLVRLLEKSSARFIDHFLLAEKAYYHELPFAQAKAATVENKYIADQIPQQEKTLPISFATQTEIRLLYSGTISFSYGILEAIKLATDLHAIYPGYRLTIIGYAAQPEVLDKLKKAIKNKPFISLIGGNRLVPYNQIVSEIQQSDLGLLPYQPNKSTENCIPTKLYEYLANRLPMLLQQNSLWQELVERWQAGITIDFANSDAAVLHAQITSALFYTNGPAKAIFWHTEEEKLLQIVGNQIITCSKPKNKFT